MIDGHTKALRDRYRCGLWSMAARAGFSASRKGKASLSLEDKHTQLVLREEAKLDTEPNPFALPSTADVFDVREQERKREAEARIRDRLR
jgi:hypothetical protein